MNDLAQALAEATWAGTADLWLPEHGHGVRAHPVIWELRDISFEFRFDCDCVFLARLMEVNWRSTPSPELVLRNVRLECGPHVLTLDELKLSRINALSEWPEDFGFDGDSLPRRLRTQPTGAQRIGFSLACPARYSEHWVMLENWPRTMSLPAQVARPGREAIRFDTNSSFAALAMRSDDPIAGDCPRIRMALQLASGAPLPTMLVLSPARCEVYRVLSAPPPSELPMFKDGQACRAPIHDMLGAALQMPEPEFELLRFAAAATVEGKNPALPLEIRYLLLMMCVEMLDGRRVLHDDSTAAMLGVDLRVAALLNGMRNQLIHAHQGGGYRNAFQAFVHQQGGSAPALPATWMHVINSVEGGLHFERLYLQLCERIDAFWCQRLNVSGAQANRYHVAGWSTLGELPPPFDPARPTGPERSNGPSGAGRHSEEMAAVLTKRNEQIDRLKQTVDEKARLIGDLYSEIKALKAALRPDAAGAAAAASVGVHPPARVPNEPK